MNDLVGSWRAVTRPVNSALRQKSAGLATEIALASRLTGKSVTRIGRESVGDPRLHRDLTLGRVLRPATRKKVLSYLRTLRVQPRSISGRA